MGEEALRAAGGGSGCRPGVGSALGTANPCPIGMAADAAPPVGGSASCSEYEVSKRAVLCRSVPSSGICTREHFRFLPDRARLCQSRGANGWPGRSAQAACQRSGARSWEGGSRGFRIEFKHLFYNTEQPRSLLQDSSDCAPGCSAGRVRLRLGGERRGTVRPRDAPVLGAGPARREGLEVTSLGGLRPNVLRTSLADGDVIGVGGPQCRRRPARLRGYTARWWPIARSKRGRVDSDSTRRNSPLFRSQFP
jgi:hypothetical protein